MGIRLLELKVRIRRTPKNKKGMRQYPVELRAEVRAYAQQRLQKGASQPKVARELGLPKDTLYMWLKNGGEQRAEQGGRGRQGAVRKQAASAVRRNGAVAKRRQAASPSADLPAVAVAFRTAVAALGERARTTAYPAELRVQALSYMQAREAEGVSMSAVARELGLGADSLRTWIGRRGGGAAQRSSVRVVNIVPETTPRRASSIVVHGPGGLRIEGLDVRAVATLLKELSC